MASRDQALERVFPRLTPSDYRLASPVDGTYNCIAYAANDLENWWWPTPKPIGGYYWPPNAPREVTLRAFKIAFEGLGYSECIHGRLEKGVEKVAIYVAATGEPTHAARQLPTGAWVSKLGPNVDIEHSHPDAVGGDDGHGYGQVAIYLARTLEN